MFRMNSYGRMRHHGWLLIIGLSGAAAVMMGAFGAHGLEGKAAEWARTGSNYQLLHLAVALALIGIGREGRHFRGAMALMIGGGWIFAGTLYGLALGAPRWLGAITPIGGSGLVLGWLLLAWSARRH